MREERGVGGSPGRARVSVPVSPDRAGSAACAGAFTGIILLFFFNFSPYLGSVSVMR